MRAADPQNETHDLQGERRKCRVTKLLPALAQDDGRWYDFGFRRPADGQQPAPVTDLVLTPGGAGIVLASWAASTNAENYRVTWKPTSSGGEPTEVGLTAETQFALTGLPSGVPIRVGVSARNAAGETLATEVTIVVP